MAPFRSHRVVFVFNGYIVTTFNLYFIETRTFMYKHRHETRYKYPPPHNGMLPNRLFPVIAMAFLSKS